MQRRAEAAAEHASSGISLQLRGKCWRRHRELAHETLFITVRHLDLQPSFLCGLEAEREDRIRAERYIRFDTQHRLIAVSDVDRSNEVCGGVHASELIHLHA